VRLNKKSIIVQLKQVVCDILAMDNTFLVVADNSLAQHVIFFTILKFT